MASTTVFLQTAQLIFSKTNFRLKITLSDSKHFSVASVLLRTAQHFVKPSHVLRGVLIFPLLMGPFKKAMAPKRAEEKGSADSLKQGSY